MTFAAERVHPSPGPIPCLFPLPNSFPCMKTTLFSALSLAVALVPARAAVYDVAYSVPSGLIPDGDLNGRADVRNVSGVDGHLTDVDVTLDLIGYGLDGGWNGDLYVSLQHESGLSVLLNRPGRGAGDSFGAAGNGMAITLDDAAANGDVHLYPEGPDSLLGSWAPDGRNVAPNATTSELDAAARTALLGLFVGMPVVGDWTLLVIDASSGGQMELREWGLHLTYEVVPTTVGVVPEASTWWTGGALVLAAALARRMRGQARG